jgi:hypothetical protein
MEKQDNYSDVIFYSKTLLSQTKSGLLTWECSEYFHPSFIKKNAIFSDDSSGILLVHDGEFYAQTENRIYNFGFHEGMDISGDMDVHAMYRLEISDLDEKPLYDFEANIDSESTNDDCNFFTLTHEVCRHSIDWLDSVYYEYTDSNIDLFLYNSYHAPKINSSFKNLKLSKLVERLIKEKRIEDFHRLLHEPKYREQLLRETE